MKVLYYLGCLTLIAFDLSLLIPKLDSSLDFWLLIALLFLVFGFGLNTGQDLLGD